MQCKSATLVFNVRVHGNFKIIDHTSPNNKEILGHTVAKNKESSDVLFDFHLEFWNTASIGILVRILR